MDLPETLVLTAESGKEFILGSNTHWSAKDLAARFSSDPGKVNEIMKGLAQIGAIAHYFLPFDLIVSGQSIPAKKYFYARWSVKAPTSFHLVNTQYAHLQGHPSIVDPTDNPNMAKTLLEAEKKLPIPPKSFADMYGYNGKSPIQSQIDSKWVGTYKESLAYKSIPTKKHGKTPIEHVMAFFNHYSSYGFTVRFLAAYFDCSPSHIAGTCAIHAKGQVHIWKRNGHRTVGLNNEWKVNDIVDFPPGTPVSALASIISTLEQVKTEYTITGKIEAANKSIFSIPKIPKFSSDPTKKVQFEIEYAKPKPKIVPDVKPDFISSSVVSKTWDMVPLNLLRECADLYILYDLSLDFDEVKPMFGNKLDFLADQFSRYLDMAIGGEVRDGWTHCKNWEYLRDVKHLKILHYLTNGIIPHGSYQRAEAQVAWKKVRDEMGIKALEEAFRFFNEGHWGNGISCSYGGPKWATAARTLLGYLNGEYTKMTFVDTVWAMQHNCDFILNKAWQVNGLANVLQLKQEGCMVDLHQFASPVVAQLWKEKRQS